jgi:hypothetical protein
MGDESNNETVSGSDVSRGPSRVFLVGCPRSGTTLLQALLGAHKDIASFPESHIFTKGRLARLAPGWVARRNLERFARMNDAKSMYGRRRWALRPQVYQLDLIRLLDKLAIERQKRLWIEKTPEHVLFISEIRRLSPSSKFIHLIRDGRAVVASLYEVTRTHAEIWGRPWRGPMSLEQCISEWNRAVLASSDAMDTRNDGIVIDYEILTTDPALELRRLSDFLALSYEPQMLTEYKAVTSTIVNPDEEWKSRVNDRIHDNGLKKYYQLFTSKQQDFIERSLTRIPANLQRR